jgi:hypothetical protein
MSEGATGVDFGPVEVIVNDTRYVREETLFAAMREVERLQEIAAAAANLVVERPFGQLDQRAFYRLREALRND